VIAYVGSELELFAQATNWKRYVASRVRPELRADVLEIGAGLGTTTRTLCNGRQRRWLCLEPDAQMAAALESAIAAGQLPACCRVQAGTLADLDPAERFDAILYVDVLEHIADDRAELETAAGHLAANGKLIVLAPAHQWLFSPFDRAIGHYRRYNKKLLREIGPVSLTCRCLAYLDAVGLVASLGNRWLLGQSMPSARQIWLWDKLMVPISRFVDPLLGHRLGKSILAIWEKVPRRVVGGHLVA
jgi:SAM-dependent methyltransferase